MAQQPVVRGNRVRARGRHRRYGWQPSTHAPPVSPLVSALQRQGVGPPLAVMDMVALGVPVAVAREALSWHLALFLVLSVVLFGSAGLYRSRLSMSLLEDLPALLGRTLIAAAVAAVVSGAAVHSAKLPAALVASTASLLAVRATSYAVVVAARRRRLIAHRTLVLGGGRVGAALVDSMLADGRYGLLPVGVVDSDPLVSDGDIPVPLISEGLLADLIRRTEARVLVLAFSLVREADLVHAIRTADRMRCQIFYVPRLFELVGISGRSGDADSIHGVPLVRLRRAAFRTSARVTKRSFDLVAATVGLLLASPLLGAIAVAVRLGVGPRVLFRQERIGIDGRPFTLLKFRSIRLSDSDAGTTWSVAQDGRMPAVGRFLRANSLDELPQLWNVLRGDMSIVGPRPERSYFVEQFAEAYPHYLARHRVPSGLTGLAQVNGLRGDTSISDRVRFDNAYIEGWSLWLDIKIVLCTVGSVLRRTGA